MEKKERCETCDRNFKDKEGLEMHNSAKHSKRHNEKTSKINYKKIRNWVIFAVVLGLIFYGIFWSFSSVKTLPPTDAQGHIEQSPDSHVLKEPMLLVIQKHMLEHADGAGPPGVIINYNCKDYNCGEELIENLEGFAEEFPANVYVAPFKDMDAKIVLTKQNGIEILEEYDEEKIRNFIVS